MSSIQMRTMSISAPIATAYQRTPEIAVLPLSMRDMVAALRARRVLVTATHVAPASMAVAAVSRLAGRIKLGWALARGRAAFLAAAGQATISLRRRFLKTDLGQPRHDFDFVGPKLKAGGGRSRRRTAFRGAVDGRLADLPASLHKAPQDKSLEPISRRAARCSQFGGEIVSKPIT
jgi:hypothetical protein